MCILCESVCVSVSSEKINLVMWGQMCVTTMESETHWLISQLISARESRITPQVIFIIFPQATVGIWNAGKNNMGFGFNRETWSLIKGCAEVSSFVA